MSTKEDVFNYVTAFTIQDGTNSWEKFLSIMSKINEFLFGFISHSTFPTLLNYFHSPNDDEKTRKINKIQLIILYTMYGLFTIFGLFCLSSEDKVIKKTLDNPGEYIINILFIIYLISLVPIRYIIIRDNYTSNFKSTYKTHLSIITGAWYRYLRIRIIIIRNSSIFDSLCFTPVLLSYYQFADIINYI